MLILRILISFFLLQSVQANAQQNGLLWKVSGNGLKKPSYLFGTYHLKSGEFLKTVKGSEEALKASEAVVGEMEITPEMAGDLMKHMVMENDQLDSLLTPAQYDSVGDFLKEKAGIPIMMMNKIKPMGIYLILSGGSMKAQSTDTTKIEPMDLWVQSEAIKDNKKVHSLETLEEQADLIFNSSSLERQVEMLMQYIRTDQSDAQKEIEKLETCYTTQNLDCLVELMNSSGYSDIESNLLLRDRNLRWLPKLNEKMKSESCFIAVGALHLAGDSGLIKLLEKEGYTVRAVRSKKDI
jgi:uncharacterized protein